MPNHVTNQVVIYSDKEDEVQRILDEIKGDEPGQYIDFAKIIPPPDNMFEGNLGKHERELCFAEGRPNWYDWQIDNWGTKWNAYAQDLSGPEYGVVTLTFDTAWSSPLPVIAALKDKYPDAEIYGSWLEEGHQSAGTF